jgi:hypothetical protein
MTPRNPRVRDADAVATMAVAAGLESAAPAR